MKTNKQPIMKMNKTYETITPESAEKGEVAERGFIFKDKEMTFSEICQMIEEDGYIHPSDSNDYCPRWISTEGETDYRTGEETIYSLHPDLTDPESRLLWAAAVINLTSK